jgi:hypothetical protein
MSDEQQLIRRTAADTANAKLFCSPFPDLPMFENNSETISKDELKTISKTMS